MALFPSIDAFLEEEGVYSQVPISKPLLTQYLGEVECSYQDLPYHNIEHIQQVIHSSCCMWQKFGLGEIVRGSAPREAELFALAFVIAAAVHDAGHTGFTNDFLIRSRHDYAITYNDLSPQEAYHASTSFRILLKGNNFLEKLSAEKFALFRQTVISLIMSTDMARHHQILSQLRSRGFNEVTSGDIPVILQAALKCADIGHTMLPRDKHVTWSLRLQEELFCEGDCWKEHSWKPASLMDRQSSADFASSQLGFFRYIVIPFLEALCQVLPKVSSLMKAAVANADHWKASQRA